MIPTKIPLERQALRFHVQSQGRDAGRLEIIGPADPPDEPRLDVVRANNHGCGPIAGLTLAL